MGGSKLQMETKLSTTVAEFIALSEGLMSIILLMNLLEEIQGDGIKIIVIRCKVFEDNSGALTMTRIPKIMPRTK